MACRDYSTSDELLRPPEPGSKERSPDVYNLNTAGPEAAIFDREKEAPGANRGLQGGGQAGASHCHLRGLATCTVGRPQHFTTRTCLLPPNILNQASGLRAGRLGSPDPDISLVRVSLYRCPHSAFLFTLVPTAGNAHQAPFLIDDRRVAVGAFPGWLIGMSVGTVSIPVGSFP